MKRGSRLPTVGFRFTCGMLLVTALLGQGCKARNPESLEKPAILSSSGPITESDLGVPLYPNATADHNQSFTFQGNSKSANSVRTISASLMTTDSIEQVKKFYREKLGAAARIEEHESGGGTLVDIYVNKPKQQVRIQAVPRATGQGSVIVILTQVRP